MAAKGWQLDAGTYAGAVQLNACAFAKLVEQKPRAAAGAHDVGDA